MDSKPIVTCHGDQNLFSKLHTSVVQGLPKEVIEWKRLYGRPRSVHVEANFVPFNPEIIPDEKDWSLPGRPFFHTYWLDCDLDGYKAGVKEEIAEWISTLKAKNVSDWLIVVVVIDESKVKTKLLRTSVYDKVKNDFCSKQADRCIVLLEPFKTDSKSCESWAGLLSRMRHLLLQSYNRNLGMFEEHMRAERERRMEKGWNFCSYFLLQEELALMFEMLRLYEDALVQYDELDALFTQYVVNHAAGDVACWLLPFIEAQNQTWDGLCLTEPINVAKRNLIKKAQSSLLDFRNYLFSRQCALTFLLGKTWEVEQKAMPFMHNCIQELKLLRVKMPAGAMDCWVFISCLEVIRTCEKKSELLLIEHQYLHTASLWDYAREKLYDAAMACGFIPGSVNPEPPGDKHMSFLIEGASLRIQKWSTDLEEETEPINKLKEALSSKEAFHKHYLELSELAMGTYKFIGRIRSARKIGQDLAYYYMKLGEWQKAEGFLLDALKVYKQEGWDMLADDIRLDIAECQRQQNEHSKLVRSCVHLAGSQFLPEATKLSIQQEILDLAENFKDEPLLVHTRPVFWVDEVAPSSESFILHHDCCVSLRLQSMLAAPVHCRKILISLVLDTTSLNASQGSMEHSSRYKRRSGHQRKSSTSSISGIEFYNHVRRSLEAQAQPLDLFQQIELDPEDPGGQTNPQTIISCGIAHRPGMLFRADSGPQGHRETEVVKDDHEFVIEATDVDIVPGENVVQLNGQMGEKGHYMLSQLCMQTTGIEFLRNLSSDQIGFFVVCDEPEVSITSVNSPVIAGLPQPFSLTLKSGSFEIAEGFTLSLKLPDGLNITGDKLHDSSITLPKLNPNQEVAFDLEIFCSLPTQADPDKVIYHELEVECQGLAMEWLCELAFVHPFHITHKLHTSGKKKFVQILIEGASKRQMSLSHHKLTVHSDDVELLAANKSDRCLVVQPEQSASYIWQLKNNLPDCPPLSCQFSVHYTPDNDTIPRPLTMDFTLTDYTTLYTASSKVDPAQGNDLCKAGSMCQLTVCVKALTSSLHHQLLYDIEADSSQWTLSGVNSGLCSLDKNMFTTQLGVIPLKAGHLPLPQVKLQKQNTNETASATSHSADPEPAFTEKEPVEVTNNKEVKGQSTHSPDRSEYIPFSAGQVYCTSLAKQVQVLPSTNSADMELIVTS